MKKNDINYSIYCRIAKGKLNLPFDVGLTTKDHDKGFIYFMAKKENIILDEIDTKIPNEYIGRILVDIINVDQEGFCQVMPRGVTYPNKFSMKVHKNSLGCFCDVLNCSECEFKSHENLQDPVRCETVL